MEHSAGDPLISAPHPEKNVEVEPLTSSCGRMVCAVHTLLTRSFSQCIMRESVVEVVGTNDWPRLARASIQLLLDLALK